MVNALVLAVTRARAHRDARRTKDIAIDALDVGGGARGRARARECGSVTLEHEG